MEQEIDLQASYNKIYSLGYHENKDLTHAKKLCAIIDKSCDFDTFLDVGCSFGWTLRHGLKEKQGIGVDIASIPVAWLQNQGYCAIQCTAQKLPFSNDAFDLYLSTDVFEHLRPEDVDAAIDEAFRVTRKYFAMKICPKVDIAPFKKAVGHDLHLTVKPNEWWEQQFMMRGAKRLWAEGEMFVLEKI